MIARVVHCKREPYDVYIGRPSIWGNPFVIGKDGDRETVISLYENFVRSSPELMNRIPELKGKVLGCWCHPLACHGDVLVRLTEEIISPMAKHRSLAEAGYTDKKPTGVSLCLHGESGVGKTELACHFPRPVLFRGPAETGVDDLKLMGTVPDDLLVVAPENWEELGYLLAEAVESKKYDTVIFETLYDLQTLCYNYVGERHFKKSDGGVDMGEGNRSGFRAFGKGPDLAVEQYWGPFFRAIVNDLLQAPMNFVLTAHSEWKTEDDVEGADYKKLRPMGDKKIVLRTVAEVQQIGFMAETLTKKKEGLKTQVTGSSGRFINFADIPHAQVKNRYKLPAVVPMGDSGREGYENLRKAFEKAGKPIAGSGSKKTSAAVPAPAKDAKEAPFPSNKRRVNRSRPPVKR